MESSEVDGTRENSRASMSSTSCLMQLKTQTKAAFYALEAVITELEATRDRLLSGLIDRVVDQAAA